MGLFSGFYKAIAREVARQTQVMAALPVNAVANYKGSDDQTLIDEAFLKNADIYSLVMMDAKKFASIPVNTYKVKSDGKGNPVKEWRRYKGVKRYMGAHTVAMRRKALEEVAEDNDISRLLNRPNPYQGADAFWQQVRGYRMITGETFIWKFRPEGQGQVTELYVLPTQYMQVVGSSVNMFAPEKYILMVDGIRMEIPREDIIHWRSWTPEFDMFNREQLRGLSPLSPLMRAITASNEANDAMVAMYQNGGAKYLVYDKTYTDLTPEQSSQLDDVINRKLNNNEMKSAVARVQGDWGGINLGLSSVDMQLLDSMKVTRRQFADAFGIPTDLIDGDKTYANRERAMKDWVSNSLYPDMKSLCDELNRALVPEFGVSSARIVIDADISMLPEMQDDMEKLTKIAADSYWIDLYTKQVLTGYEPDEQFKGVYLMPSGLVPFEQMMTEGNPPLTPEQEDDALDMYDQQQ